ncbi:MAG: NYN domain-containing protein [Clostridia bacterium]|nr:NYN domain-containing protein [Clostridia bacterium]
MFWKSKKKKKAVAFVDYEYWFYSHRHQLGMRPDPAAWLADVQAQYELIDIKIFGDFSNNLLAEDLGELRNITNSIIETGNTYKQNKKDMTDFIMLDHIYQHAADHKNIQVYLILTGDGHFQSVVNYLKKKQNKKVIVCGAPNTMSRFLQGAADEVMHIPRDEVLFFRYAKMIVDYVAEVSSSPARVPTFVGTVYDVARARRVPREQVEQTLIRMIEIGYLTQKERAVPFAPKIPMLAPNWDLLIKDGLWVVD